MHLQIAGRLVDKLKRQRFVIMVAHKVSQHFPFLWGSIMRRVKYMHLTYRVSLRERYTNDDFQNSADLNNQAWQERQLLKSATKSSAVGEIYNRRPSIDPKVLLEKINKNLNAGER